MRYFFDTTFNERTIHDDEGVEFASTHDMRDNAIRTLALMGVDELPDGGVRHELAIVAYDEQRTPIFKANLTFRSQWTEPTHES